MFKVKIFFISLVVFLLAPIFSLHADSVGVSVDQSVFAFSVEPGGSQEIRIRVRSLAQTVQKMSVATQDFVVGDSANEIVQLTDNNEQFGMKDWVKADQVDWFLDSEQTQEIKLTVTVPNDATVGAHYAIANIKALPQIDGQNFQQSIVGGQVGVYLLLNVKGAVSGSGNLKKFSAPLFAEKNSALQAEYENTGNILYIPHGEIYMQNLLTRRQTSFETEKHFVFPGKNFSFDIKWSPDSIFGAYKAKAAFVDANGAVHVAQRFLFGKLFFVALIVLLICIFFGIGKIMKIAKSKQ